MSVSAVRVRALRWGLRVVFGAPRPLKRLAAGRPVRLDGQTLDLDLQLLNRLGTLLVRRTELSAAALAEQRRQAELAAEFAADGAPRDVTTEERSLSGPAGAAPARLYLPPGAARGPLLVFFHGGGFVMGSLTSHDPLCRLVAAQSGVRVLSVDYRLAPEHPYPAALDDALAAFRHVVAHADDFGADPRMVAVGGDSAGGNLALVVAHQQAVVGGPRPAFVMTLYPATDAAREAVGSRETFGSGFGITTEVIARMEEFYLPDGVPSDDARGAILRADDLSGMPPVYLATAGFDPLRDEGEELVERLRAAAVPVAARRFPGLVHGYASFTAVSPAARDATLDAASALRAGLALGPGRVGARRAGRASGTLPVAAS